jgi:ribosome maturation factor RimP
VFWGLAAIIVMWEWTTLVCGPDRRSVLMTGIVAVALAAALAASSIDASDDMRDLRLAAAPIVLILGMLASAIIAPRGRGCWVAVGVPYAGAMGLAPIVLRSDTEFGFVAIIFLFAVVWVTDIAAIAKQIEPEVKSLGYDLVRVAMIGGTSDPTLQVMAERPDTRQLDLSDCETISRRLSEWLDAKDPIEGSFRLEVSSPGIDRPLTRLTDYADWAGYDARISLKEPRGDRKQFSGKLEGLDGDKVKLTDKSGQAQSLPFSHISSAKLLLTDKLINATAPLSTEGADLIKTEG